MKQEVFVLYNYKTPRQNNVYPTELPGVGFADKTFSFYPLTIIHEKVNTAKLNGSKDYDVKKHIVKPESLEKNRSE